MRFKMMREKGYFRIMEATSNRILSNHKFKQAILQKDNYYLCTLENGDVCRVYEDNEENSVIIAYNSGETCKITYPKN